MVEVTQSELTDFNLKHHIAPVAPRFMVIAGIVGMLAWFISLDVGNPNLGRLAIFHVVGGGAMILLGRACQRTALAGRAGMTTIISVLFILVTATFVCVVAANNHTGLLQSLPYCMVMIVIAGFFWANRWGVVVGSIAGMVPPAILVMSGHSVLTVTPRLVSIYMQLCVTALAAAFFMYLFMNRVRRGYLVALRELEELSRRDALTGLFNRRHFHDLVNARLAEAAPPRAGRGALLLYVDVDHFKTINDRLGHAEGDLVLQQMARMLERVCDPADVIARFGGEEFVIYRPDIAMGEENVLAATIRTALRESGQQQGGLLITVSIGGTVGVPGEPLEAALQRADTALLRAKREGRDRMILVLEPSRTASGSGSQQGRRESPVKNATPEIQSAAD